MARGHPDWGIGTPVDDWAVTLPPQSSVGQYELVALQTVTANGQVDNLVLPPCGHIFVVVDVDTMQGTNPRLLVFLCVLTRTGEQEVLGSTGPIPDLDTWVFVAPYLGSVYSLVWQVDGTNPQIAFRVNAFVGP